MIAIFRLPTAVLSLFVLGVIGCSREQSSDESGIEIHPMRGLVRVVRPAEGTLMIEHEDVPGYMPSMTMPFSVREPEDLEGVNAGDAIAFEFVVSGFESWIRAIRPIEASTLKLPEPREAPVPTNPQAPRLREGDRMPSFELVDQRSRRIDRQTFEGKAVILTFIFTRCPVPDFCPLMASRFEELEKEIKKDPGRAEKVRLLSISFDPEHDTPEVLARYAAEHTRDGDFWRFATGSPEEVAKLTHAFSVYTQAEGGTINHGLCTALAGPDGTIRKLWRGNGWKPGEVLEELADCLDSPAEKSSTSTEQAARSAPAT